MKLELNHYLEFLALVVAIIYHRNIRGSRIFWVLPFLAFILFAELGASYYKYILRPKYNNTIDNTHIYIWVSIFETGFYSYMIYEFLHSGILKRISSLLSALMVFAFLFLFFFFKDYLGQYYYYLVVQGYILTIICCFYFYELFGLDYSPKLAPISKRYEFWFSLGVLVFFAGMSVVNSFYYYIKTIPFTIAGLHIYNIIPQILSIFLYGSISLSIILWSTTKKK